MSEITRETEIAKSVKSQFILTELPENRAVSKLHINSLAG